MNKLIIIITLVICTSCTMFLYEELAHIHKGMNATEVTNVIDSGDYGPGIELINDDINEDLYSADNNIKYLVTEKFTPQETEYYIFVFQNDKLVYWGAPYQIANHSDPDISNSSYEISKTVKEKYID